MWEEGVQPKTQPYDVNEELSKLTGELDEGEAMTALYEFLRYNLKITTFLLSGFRLATYQVLMMKGWFLKNFSLNVWGRGCAKSTLAGIFAFLYAIFNPGATILIVSQNFRSSRRILEAIERLTKIKPSEDGSGGVLLEQCFDKDHMTRRNDLYKWDLHPVGNNQASSIVCVPLSNGEGLRGLRANVIILDEALLVPKQIITQILIPFLVSNGDVGEKLRIREIEDNLIRRGIMKEEERMEFPSKAKLIMLSSASYTWQYLYEIYQDYKKKISETGAELPASYFISQLSYEMVPKEILDEGILSEATGGTTSQSVVDMEYKARFQDGSDGYFSAKKMNNCTIPDGSYPCVELIGDPSAEYVLGIDPAFSSSTTADHFAMSVLKIVEKKDGKKIGMLVHSYALAGADLKDHIAYFAYLLENFNIVYIACDTTQGDAFDFLNTVNESALFKSKKLEILPIEAEFNREDIPNMAKQIRASYNLTARRIAQKQSFAGGGFIRSANEYMQACFDYKNLLFASRCALIDDFVENYRTISLPILSQHSEFNNKLGGNKMFDFMEWQDSLIDLTKKECAMIEVTISPQGNQSFDLPQNLRRNKSNPTRPRKDNYSSLLLANWGLKLYVEAMSLEVKPVNATFTPIMIQ